MTKSKGELEKLISLGLASKRTGDRVKALSYFQEAIQAYPNYVPAYAQARTELQKLGRVGESNKIHSFIFGNYPQQIYHFMDDRAGRINVLSRFNHSKTYLEIGVDRGETFSQVMIENKVAVDPRFKFDYASEKSDSLRFYEMTSDEYFTSEASDCFDFIYLDGLHTFEQTFRDFCATWAMSHGKTIWLIDDTVPTDVFAADKSQRRSKTLRDEVGIQDNAWMGDVFKTVCAIHDFFPQFSFATFNNGHGQTVIWQKTRDHFKPKWNSLSAISELGFLDFLESSKEVMHFASPEEIIERLRASF